MIEASVAGRVAQQSTPGALPWWCSLVCALAGGFALDLATPGVEWWPAGLLGAGLVMAAIWQQRALAGLAFGLVAGAAFWLPHISWLTLYLGPIPWLALSSVMIVWFGLFGLLASFATRGLRVAVARSIRANPEARWLSLAVVQAVTVSGLWVLREQVQSTWPYGGFAWGRLAHTQADGPLVALVSWLGFAGLSGLLAFACALTVGVLFTVRTHTILAPIAATATLSALALLTLVPPAVLEHSGSMRVAAVQGNSKSGIFDDRENGDVIRDHLEATEALLDELETNDEHIDLIVWPENSGEFQLPDQHYRSLAVKSLAKRAQAPIVVGTILQNADGTFTNSSVVFDDQGDTGLRYDKRRPVPFAEYMPNRAFFHALVPDLVDLVQLDYAFGQRSSVLAIETERVSVEAGIAICFDIIFDDHAIAMISDGAGVILAQTNNADFGRTDESAQQLQIARLRAVETGRTVVNISTVGTSAIVAADGSDLAWLTPFTADAMIAEVELVTGETPALRYGAALAAAWMLLGILGLVAAAAASLAQKLKPFLK